MPVRQEIDESAGRARLELTGEIRLSEAIAALARIQEQATARGISSLLVNLMEMEYRPSPEDLSLFPELGERARHFEGGVALVASGPRNGGIARVVVAWARARLLPMALFLEEAAALRWLEERQA